MGVDEGNLQDKTYKYMYTCMILENCPITIVIRNLLVYSTLQYNAIP